MIFNHQLRIAGEIIENYRFDIPYHRYLVDYFRAHKNMGSRDRKLYSNLTYNYFRVSKALTFLSLEEQIIYANFLLNTTDSLFIRHFIDNYSLENYPTLENRLQWLKQQFSNFIIEDIFPFEKELTPSITRKLLVNRLLEVPKVFIRVRKNFKEPLISQLKAQGAPFELDTELEHCIAHPPQVKLNTLFTEQQMNWFEVQDRSSQWACSFFKPNTAEHWWDACAGSGGKSLSLIDACSTIQLTCSDLRDTILENLRIRFKNIGYKNFIARKIDLTKEITSFEKECFDGIILDVPCSGSGTWSRSPEMLLKFNASQISFYNKLQHQILENASQYLKSGKYLYYITCSVFKAENEEVIEQFLSANKNFNRIEQQYLFSSVIASDAMFISILQKT